MNKIANVARAIETGRIKFSYPAIRALRFMSPFFRPWKAQSQIRPARRNDTDVNSAGQPGRELAGCDERKTVMKNKLALVWIS